MQTSQSHRVAQGQQETAVAPRGRNIRLTVEYDGTSYAGWQRQTNCLTVQQVLEEALAKQLGHPVRVYASGRTDQGVHALGQVVNFFTPSAQSVRGIERGTLLHLPFDVAISRAQEAPPDFDARRSARMRWYRFFLCNRSVRPAVGARYMTHVVGRLDEARMCAAAEALSGDHDFQAFRAITCNANRTRLNLLPVQLHRTEEHVWVFDFRCRSFLQNMIRILAGTIVASGRGKLSVDDIREMLATGERRKEATTLPPHGLFLWRVMYPGDPGAEELID